MQVSLGLNKYNSLTKLIASVDEAVAGPTLRTHIGVQISYYSVLLNYRNGICYSYISRSTCFPIKCAFKSYGGRLCHAALFHDIMKGEAGLCVRGLCVVL